MHLVIETLNECVPSLNHWRIRTKHVHQHFLVGEDANAAPKNERLEAVESLEKSETFLFEDIPRGLTGVEKTAIRLQ